MKVPAAAPRNRMFARVARLVSCCFAAAMVWACGPVYIPVPPPMAGPPTFMPQIVTDDAGNPKQVWIATGSPDALAGNATYYLFNQDRNAGVITRAATDGSYQAPPMDGAEGEHVFLYYKDTRGEDSSARCSLLSTMAPAADCP